MLLNQPEGWRFDVFNYQWDLLKKLLLVKNNSYYISILAKEGNKVKIDIVAFTINLV